MASAHPLSSSTPPHQRALTAVTAAASAADAASILPSRGETADDVAAGDLRFLLLCCWRGDLRTRAAPPARADPAARAAALRAGATELRAFVQDAVACEAVPKSVGVGVGDGDDAGARDPATVRAAKIAAFKRRKQLEADAAAALTAPTDDDDDGDSDGARRRVLAALELACVDAAASAAAADTEAALLDYAAQRQPGQRREADEEEEEADPDPSVVAALRGAAAALAGGSGRGPLAALDRAAARDFVIRPGHNLPTMSLAEFAEREVADARARGERARVAAAARADRGTALEPDGGPNLDAARALDDWKDDHPYGYGDSKKRPTATGS